MIRKLKLALGILAVAAAAPAVAQDSLLEYVATSCEADISVAIAYVAQSCETEIKTMCGDVKAGEGRILTCLEGNSESLGDACKKALADTLSE
jgi:hypothetical protein